jgi:hypothetical protein
LPSALLASKRSRSLFMIPVVAALII